MLCYATGKTAEQLGDIYQKVIETPGFKEPIYVEDDFSRFDSTISEDALDFELWIYQTIFGCDQRVMQVLNEQLNTRGYTKNGLTY